MLETCTRRIGRHLSNTLFLVSWVIIESCMSCYGW